MEILIPVKYQALIMENETQIKDTLLNNDVSPNDEIRELWKQDFNCSDELATILLNYRPSILKGFYFDLEFTFVRFDKNIIDISDLKEGVIYYAQKPDRIYNPIPSKFTGIRDNLYYQMRFNPFSYGGFPENAEYTADQFKGFIFYEYPAQAQ